jgi:hypothetical protein
MSTWLQLYPHERRRRNTKDIRRDVAPILFYASMIYAWGNDPSNRKKNSAHARLGLIWGPGTDAFEVPCSSSSEALLPTNGDPWPCAPSSNRWWIVRVVSIPMHATATAVCSVCVRGANEACIGRGRKRFFGKALPIQTLWYNSHMHVGNLLMWQII